MIRRVLVLLVFAAPPAVSLADQVGNQFFNRKELSVVRRDAAKLGKELFAFQAPAATPPKLSWSLSIGGAFDDGQDGSRVWTTPFDLGVATAGNLDTFDLVGDGYTRAHQGGTTATGLADVTAKASHAFKLSDSQTLRIGGAIILPTHGDVGSTSLAERLTASFTQANGAWRSSLAANLRHDGSSPAGASRFSQSVLAQLMFAPPAHDGNDLALQLIRGWRSGVGGSTTAALAADFPISGQLAGSFSLARGLTQGDHDNSAEFDLNWSF